MNTDFEHPASFYLGREYDLGAKQVRPEPVLYDSKDLTTHAVCVGMTGSGKTGLCLGLIEEAAIDGIPAILIDPKGDLANLMLTFPDLAPADFEPWVNPDQAAADGVSIPELAARQAEIWREGLAEWGQDGDRIRRLKEAADVCVYTPGSQAGLPVSILKSFTAPSQAVLDDPEALADRVGTTTTALLTLAGIDADPVRSREHILIATIIGDAWRQGHSLELGELIHLIQNPPVTRVGVMEVDTFFPAKDRFALSLAINNLLAAPGFEAWMQGEALNIAAMLRTPAGKPRMSIFSIAHLNDSERMFFVTLILSEVLAWTRSQAGTTSLRALVYMDEIAGYFPPVANPPSKAPLLTLLKQARAFGVGVVLATQNPVDLDYKGLSNTGTWLIGRLQTARDKERVLEGLEGAAAGTGAGFDRARMEETLAGLGKRVFLMNNVHEDEPVVFTSRWVMSYMAGPMTQKQIRQLMAPVKAARDSNGSTTPVGASPVGTAAGAAPLPGAASTTPGNAEMSGPAPLPSAAHVHAGVSGGVPLPVGASGNAAADAIAGEGTVPASSGSGSVRPVLPPDIPQYFLPARGGGGAPLVYAPMVYGAAEIRFADTKSGIDTTTTLNLLVPIGSGAVAVDWSAATPVDLGPADLESSPESGADFGDLPAAAAKAAAYTAFRRELVNWAYGSQTLELLRSPAFRTYSRLGETEADFRLRLNQDGREKRDAAVEALRKKYAGKVGALQERIRKAEAAVEREADQARQAKLQTAISVGGTVLGAFLGRKAKLTNLGRATTAVRGASRAAQQSGDVKRAEENVEALRSQLGDLDDQLKAETEALAAANDPMTEELETVTVRPKKTNISAPLVALAWAPTFTQPSGEATPGW